MQANNCNSDRVTPKDSITISYAHSYLQAVPFRRQIDAKWCSLRSPVGNAKQRDAV